MKTILKLACIAAMISSAAARGPNPSDITVSHQEMGSPGIIWYATWDAGLAEARRSQRPIFFMVAAAQCRGISGVF